MITGKTLLLMHVYGKTIAGIPGIQYVYTKIEMEIVFFYSFDRSSTWHRYPCCFSF